MEQIASLPDPVDELVATMLEADPKAPRPVVRLGTERDAVDGHVPGIVACPRSKEQAAAAVRFAAARNMSVAPVGGKTQCHWGGALRRADLLLDLSEMNRIVEYVPDDMTVTVEAGCTLIALQERLASHGQFLPIDPAATPEATLGGLVATAAAGPSQHGSGTMRDYLLGASFIRANGEIVRSGSRVVKSAAGYEVHKLLIGSLGTLGVLAELTFMVRPLPRERRMLFIPLPHVAAVEPVLASLMAEHLEVQLIELLNKEALRRLPQTLLPQEAAHAAYGLFVGLIGSPVSASWQEGRVADLVTSLPVRSNGCLAVHSLSWQAAYEGLLAARRFSKDALVCRARLLSSNISGFLEEVDAILIRRGISSPLFAHAGSGVVHIPLHPIPADAPALVDELRASASRTFLAQSVPPLAQEEGTSEDRPLSEHLGWGEVAALRRLRTGRLVIESAPAHLRRQLSVWGERTDQHALATALKATLDPQGVLNPGRL